MDKAFRKVFRKLTENSTRFDREGSDQNYQLLKELQGKKLPEGRYLNQYMYLLLFMMAYPGNRRIERMVNGEISRISSFLKNKPAKQKEMYINTGLPFTLGNSKFSHDCLRWLLSHPDVKVTADTFQEPVFELNDILKLTLPSTERSETTAGLDNEGLFEALHIKQDNKLDFLVQQLAAFDALPFVKDQLFDSLGLFVITTPRNKYYSLPYNKSITDGVFYHHDLLKKFDVQELLNSKLPDPVQFSDDGKQHMLKVIKNAMSLTDRETDPTTYSDPESLRFYHLDRGISIAIYGMMAPRQLPLENYAGFTLFKNGLPAAYGGCWVFGQRANFGINVFEPYRGGESGYIICQLLRVYRQVFGIDYFEVEPYQFGLDNPDGIKSGAFWFYHRFGFRPIDKDLFRLSESEYLKIKAGKNYRSSEKTLLRFTGSNIALKLAEVKHESVPEICTSITRKITKDFKGDRSKAISAAVSLFLKESGLNFPENRMELQVLEEIALWAATRKRMTSSIYNIMAELISIKPANMYLYQEKLLELFKRE